MTPKILLIGYGKFGKAHFEVLEKLQEEKQIILSGIVTKTQKIKNLSKNVATYTHLTLSLLQSVNAVIIVTPATTHFELIKKCLAHTNVFVEKPLCLTTKEGDELIKTAKNHQKILAVGHIFRFNHAVSKLKKIISSEKELPYYIKGRFTGGDGEPTKDCGVVTSNMHLIDVLDEVLKISPLSVLSKGQTNIQNYAYEDQASISLKYHQNIEAHLYLAYTKTDKIRDLTFYFPKKEIHIDLLKQSVTVCKPNKKNQIIYCYKKQPLRMELEGFVKAVKTNKGNYINGEIANRIVGIIEKCRESMKKNKVIFMEKNHKDIKKNLNPKIAVIGGGVFGVSIARELGEFANVTLLERNDDIFTESSLVNQNRHHYGYHYHQSDETTDQCKIAKKDFEKIWGKAILNKFPSYYCIAKHDSQLTPNEFRSFCKKHKLYYKEEWPSEDLLHRDEISACFKTFEPVYDPTIFKRLAIKNLREKNVAILLKHEVKDGKIVDRKKILTIQNRNNLYTEAFDYVINATYANINVFCKWFDFEPLKIDFRLKELLYIYIPNIKPIGITIMDKFSSVLPVDGKGLFSLGDVIKSFHQKKISTGAIPWTKKDLSRLPSHKKDILEGNFHFIPILKSAKLKEARWTVLPVKTWVTNHDNRTTEVRAHGQGCWSVLGGKIITSVATAKLLRNTIRKEQI